MCWRLRTLSHRRKIVPQGGPPFEAPPILSPFPAFGTVFPNPDCKRKSNETVSLGPGGRLLFSFMAAFVKLTSDQLGTLELVFYRSIFGVLSIGFFVWKSGLSVKTPYLGGHIKRSVLGTLSVALWFYTLGKLPSGRT